jgi:hypothetical protein
MSNSDKAIEQKGSLEEINFDHKTRRLFSDSHSVISSSSDNSETLTDSENSNSVRLVNIYLLTFLEQTPD